MMSWKEKALLISGALFVLSATILKLVTPITFVQFVVLMLIGIIICIHSFDHKKRALIARDEFIRRVNQNSMALSWRYTQYLVIALLFATTLHWIELNAVWMLVIVSVFMTVSYLVFMIPMFNKGEVE